MKKWVKFFCLGFFSDEISKEGAKRGYTNVFLGLLLAFALLFAGFVGADMLPFSTHYKHSPDFQSTVHSVLSNPDLDKRVSAEIADGRLTIRGQDGEYTEGLVINTFESDEDKANYSVGGYDVVVDSRPADALAQIEAYALSNDGKNTKITYEEYLTLSDVARLNFDFKLRYTGEELELTDALVEQYRLYLDGESESKAAAQEYDKELEESKITKIEYNRAIYQLYFTNYYPEITEYESSSKFPLLRNYYYHQYIKASDGKYLFIFDDYMTGSFETDGGIDVSFYGFYSELEDGVLVGLDTDQTAANKAADAFIRASFAAVAPVSMYAHAMNVFTFVPFIALMPMVVALLAYSILKLRGIEIVSSLGDAFKIVGAYVWFSALVSGVLTVIASFFVQPRILTVLPLLLLFITLTVRSVIYAVNEAKAYVKQSEQQETVDTEA